MRLVRLTSVGLSQSRPNTLSYAHSQNNQSAPGWQNSNFTDCVYIGKCFQYNEFCIFEFIYWINAKLHDSLINNRALCKLHDIKSTSNFSVCFLALQHEQ